MRTHVANLRTSAVVALIGLSCLASKNPLRGEEARSQLAPVILLTGFEPFGPSRTPNPSWEGIKDLDGKTWKGYRLVCRQLPVIWGAPLPELARAIEELHPTAIFSFGQGHGYAIETVADNLRENIGDNHGDQPAQRSIVPGGPAQLMASIDARSYAERLGNQGHPVRISKEAGGYLCEETLYSLEYLKNKNAPEMDVMFCHVPDPAANRESPASVQNFVMGVLLAWNDEKQPSAEPAPERIEADPRDKEVRRFIETYFRTWSAGEMDKYANCFHAEAVIQYINKDQIRTQLAEPFLADQRKFQGKSQAVEVPLSAEIRFEGPLARAVVHWKLTRGFGGTRYGYDHFTLIQQDGVWKIVNLVFYETKGS